MRAMSRIALALALLFAAVVFSLAAPRQAGAVERILRFVSDVKVERNGDLIVTETPREGWTVASGPGLTVALDLTLTPELERAGLVREVVRLLQEARKNSGLEVSDRIELSWVAEGPIAEALTEHADQVAREVLAVRVQRATGEGSGFTGPEGLRFWVARATG